MLPVWSQRLLVDNGRPDRLLVRKVAIDQGRLDLASLIVSISLLTRTGTHDRIVARMESGVNFDESDDSPTTRSKLDDCPFTPLDTIQRPIFGVLPSLVLTSPCLPAVRHVDTSPWEDQVLGR
jgi:hypothetical protein